MTSKDLLNMPDVSNVGNIDDDNERVKTIVLSFLYERRNLGRTTLNPIQARIKSMRPDIVEMDFRDLFLDTNWIDFSASDGSALITSDGISEYERIANS